MERGKGRAREASVKCRQLKLHQSKFLIMRITFKVGRRIYGRMET